MKMRRPFTVCPWQSDFMEALLERALADTNGDVGAATFIFPHGRPERYLSRLLRRDGRVRRPLLAPRCLTVSGLFGAIRAGVCARSAWNAGLLDRVGLLLECARLEAGPGSRQDAGPQAGQESRPGSGPDAGDDRSFALLLADARRFFPWGLRLASLFEECFVQGRKPENFFNAGGQVTPFAEALLARLARIFERYTAGLAEREWTTPGFDAALAADWLRERGQLPPGLITGEVVYIAGFHALTGTEDLLFRHLWEHHGARVMIHADPALVGGGAGNAAGPAGTGSGGRGETREPHWSCRAFLDWAGRWRASLELAPGAETAGAGTAGTGTPGAGAAGKGSGQERRIRYYEGFDLHSQLTVLERELADLDGQGAGQKLLPADEGAGRDALPENAEREEIAADGEITDNGAADEAGDTVVVLPDSGLLMPVLHHLPDTRINVSMGYPLTRSPLFRLLDTLLRLQEGRRGEGYYWRDLADLVRHPYIKMLRPLEEDGAGNGPHNSARPQNPEQAEDWKRAQDSEQAEPGGDSRSGEASLRRELYRLEQALHERGRKFARPRALLEQAYLLLDPEEMPSRPVLALLERLLTVCLENFERPRTPDELGRALEELCSLLLKHGGPLWKRFLIDAECLYRLMRSLIPELRLSRLGGERFLPRTLFAMLRRLMEAERVPFEAAPLVGLQVMGMLETRLLSFRRVIVADAGEDALPGAPTADPLLPEALRQDLGLPPLHAREQVAAYHFFRLLNGASEVVLLWQRDAGGSGIQEGRKKRSRFIEELLWEEEKRLGRLLEPKGSGVDGPLTVLASAVAPVARQRRTFPVTPAMRALFRSLLDRPLSASLLDGYLRCPTRFFLQRLARLAPAEEINEGDDPAAVGDLLHQVLHEGYSRHADATPLPGGEGLAALLGGELTETLYASPAFAALSRVLPADSFAMLGCAGAARLETCLERQPPSAVLALEFPLAANFARKGIACALTGKADRIDLRRFALNPLPEKKGRSGKNGDAAHGKHTDAADAGIPAGAGNAAHGKGAAHAGTAAGESAPGLIILDYKTGRLPAIAPGFWDDRELWQRLREWRPGPEGPANPEGALAPGSSPDSAGHPGPEGFSGPGDLPGSEGFSGPGGSPAPEASPGDAFLLRDLSRRLESVQLPLYLLMHSLCAADDLPPGGLDAFGRRIPALDAAWIDLGDSGEEKTLFPKDFSRDRRAEIVENTLPDLLYFLLRHMLESNALVPHPGKHCDWCSCAKLCMLSSPFL